MKKLAHFVSKEIVISLVFFAVFFVITLHVNQLVLQAILASVAASFMFTFVFYFFSICLQRIDRRHFQRFFGKAAINNQLHIVYPTFVLSDEARSTLKHHNEQLIYRKFNPRFSRTYRIDVPHVVAENDLCALAYLVGLFGETCRNAPPIRVDSEAVVHSNDSFISLGLSSNECTHMYLQHCSVPMFEIVPDEKGSEYLTYNDVEGQQKELKSTSNTYYGVILKYHPDPEDGSDRLWFLCAGLGPNGTSGSAWYLANKWRQLYRKVGTNDFVAFIRVQHYSDSDSNLVDWKKRNDVELISSVKSLVKT
jgi:hypothetical protein